jgi:hypothetical protein
MPLSQMQLNLIQIKAEGFAYRQGLPLEGFTVVIPQESQDWGWDFHPDYHEMVNTAEIHTTEGLYVLVINEDYEVINSDYSVHSYDF